MMSDFFRRIRQPASRVVQSSKAADLGPNVLTSVENAKVDVIFLHGLTGHREKTWTAEGEAEPWPKSLLPKDLPTARIITYGYDADVLHLTRVAGQNTVREHAKTLVNDLSALRIDTVGRPIIFVVHSLGGLVIQDALLICDNPNDEGQSDILSSTRGIAFLGTPHAGADLERFATAVANIVSLVKKPNKKMLDVLRQNSEILANIRDGFHTMVVRRRSSPEPIKLHAFIEELPVDFLKRRVVEPDSARIPGYNFENIPATHIDMTKFRTSSDIGYIRVLNRLKCWIDDDIVDGTYHSKYVEIYANHLIEAGGIDDAIGMQYTEELRKILSVECSKSNSRNSVPEICNSSDIEESLEWLLNSSEYRVWKHAYSSNLLIHGERGDGKTVAMSYILQSLRLDPPLGRDRDIVSFFCSHWDSELKIVASLAYQLLLKNNNRAKAARKNVPIWKFEPRTRMKAIWELLGHIIEVHKETIFVIDGIDKLNESERSSFLQNFRRIENEIGGIYKRGGMRKLIGMLTTDHKERREPDNTPMRVVYNIPMKVLISTETIDDIMSKLAHYSTIDREKERRECLKTLAFEEWNARESRVEDVEDGGRWLASHTQYTQWSEDSIPSVLWLEGKPGSGKSILAKLIVNKLEDRENGPGMVQLNSTPMGKQVWTFDNPKDKSTIIARFYYSFRGGNTETSHEHMLRSIVYQIWRDNSRLYELLRNRYQELQKSREDWSYEDLKSALRSLHQIDFSLRVVIVVDGMDESDSDKRADVLRFLPDLAVPNSNCIIKVLIASRPESDISFRLRRTCSHHIKLQDVNKEDIRFVVERWIERMEVERNCKVDSVEFVKDYILKASSGIFLWVILVLREMEKSLDNGLSSKADLNKIFLQLPKDKEMGSEDPKLEDGQKGSNSVQLNDTLQRRQSHKTDTIDVSIQDGRTQHLVSEPPTDSGYASTHPVARDVYHKTRCSDEYMGKYETELAGEDIEDAQTEYSLQSSTTHSRQQIFISELATHIFNAMKPFHMDRETLKQIPDILPELLKAFSLKIGHHGSNATIEMHRDAMVFIHRYRGEISAVFADQDFDQDEEDLDEKEANSDSVTWKSRIELLLSRTEAWHQEANEPKSHTSSPPISVQSNPADMESRGKLLLSPTGAWNREENESKSHTSSPSDIHDQPSNVDSPQHLEKEVEDIDEPWFVNWRDFILETDDFKWLIMRLQKQFQLAPTKPDAIGTIANGIKSSLPSPRRITRKMSSPSYNVIFELDWDIIHFLETQQYMDPPENILEGIITLTGSCLDAQAVTCAQYLRQTWPLTGDIILQLVKQVLMSEKEQSCELPDGTVLRARIENFKFTVEADGVAVSIGETGEQFAWLGAALRSSPQDNGLFYCTPTIQEIKKSPLNQPGSKKSSVDTFFVIGFELEIASTAPSVTNGQCWHGIFNNPVVVRGYPIPRRVRWDTGLEIPLNIMAGLAQSQRIDLFGNEVFIKGFSTTVVPVKREKDIIYWHLIYKQDGSHLSYLDANVEQDKEICSLPLEDFRHVLGWCSEAHFFGASKSANYSVAHSKLRRPNATNALFETSVRSGRLIVGGSPFHTGLKDTPIHVARSGHITQLEWIVTKFVLLWDERDKRGWLINGASALLHLVRASLKHDKEGLFKSVFLLNPDDLQESAAPLTAKSAIDVMINDMNRDLKIFKEDNGYVLLKDRINHFFNILEKLIDHQAHIAGDYGKSLGHMPRNCLESWDFEELAKRNRDPLHSYVAPLETQGKSWVDFTRAIQAVTLVGRGFGDIIQSAQTDICNEWTKLPMHQYYIASCISDLRDVVEEHSFSEDGHVRLNETTIWHTPTTIFGSCRCKGDSKKGRCEPVQTLFPSDLSQNLKPRKQPIPEDDSGALIFGSHSTFPWIWGDTGHPQEGAKECALSPDSTEKNLELLAENSVSSSRDPSESDTPDLSMSRTSSPSTILSKDSQSRPMTRHPAVSLNGTRYTRMHYTVGIICALPKELAAMLALFDIKHDRPEELEDDNDDNHYEFGVMEGNMVVAAALPVGEYGTNSAASVATNMNRSFPALSFCLVVGIGGGVPTKQNDIRLGDVVIGVPQGCYSGIVQYDLGKENSNGGFKNMGNMNGPSRSLRSTISNIMANKSRVSDSLALHLRKVSSGLGMSQYTYPGQELDILYENGAATCSKCRSKKMCPRHVRTRVRRTTKQPTIHYGLIASGNRVIKNALLRDRLAREHGFICFEMEAAGVTNQVDCLVIRGICDYCDHNKNDAWQEYAAATAAAYAKVFLGEVKKKPQVHRSLS